MGGSRKKFQDTSGVFADSPLEGQSVGSYDPSFSGNAVPQYQNSGMFGDNAYTQAAGGISAGMDATAAAGMYRPEQVQAGQMAGTDLSPYTNQYENQVVQQTTDDMMRAQQIQQNLSDYQMGAAGAFGGSRHGIAQAESNRNFYDRLGAAQGQLRQAGFQNAQNQAQQDLSRQYQADTFNVGADERTAQRAIQAGNQLGQMGNLGFTQAQQINTDIRNQGNIEQLMNQQLIDAAKGQFAGYTGAPASTIGYLSNALGATTVPVNSQQTKDLGLFDYLSNALGATTVPVNSQQTKDLGLFDYLSMGTQVAGAAMGSDMRLKENITKIGELADNIGLYTWTWNDKAYEVEDAMREEGITIGNGIGVMAQEVEEVHPEFIVESETGFKAVNYQKLLEVYH